MAKTNAEIAQKALALSTDGRIVKEGRSERKYIFKFGWGSRLQLESMYGKGLTGIEEDESQYDIVANMLMAGLKAERANNLVADFGREQMFDVLDDLSESDIEDVYLVARHSLGFINRLLIGSPEEIDKLTQRALENQSQPASATGTPS
jgi:hypothetical protein